MRVARMTKTRDKSRSLMLFFAMATVLFVIVEVLSLGTALRNPSFVFFSEAVGDSSPWLIKARLRVAGMLGGRADTALSGYDNRSPLEVAGEKENVAFLREAVSYSSSEHVKEVFEFACVEDRAVVVTALRERVPGLECRPPAQR